MIVFFFLHFGRFQLYKLIFFPLDGFFPRISIFQMRTIQIFLFNNELETKYCQFTENRGNITLEYASSEAREMIFFLFVFFHSKK